jgi:hypothetical protein
LLGFETESDGLFGFGVWTHAEAVWPGEDETQTVIRVPWFGVTRELQGARTSQGHSCAGVLYATVEADAVGHAGSVPGMPVELFCDERNERGLRFWARRGFIEIGTADGAEHLKRLVRVPPS